MTNIDNVAERPATFDARLMQYRPGLIKLAGKFTTTREERNDLVTDTIIHCLKNWRSFREDGGFWNWLYWSMRGVVGNKREGIKARIQLVQDTDGVFAATRGTAPSQLDYVELSQTLSKMTGRGGKIVVRRAMGETLPVIAADLGITAERVRQLECREMKRLKCVRAA
jgi:RNA polymerase sigma factor (sigma-70 family)